MKALGISGLAKVTKFPCRHSLRINPRFGSPLPERAVHRVPSRRVPREGGGVSHLGRKDRPRDANRQVRLRDGIQGGKSGGRSVEANRGKALRLPVRGRLPAVVQDRHQFQQQNPEHRKMDCGKKVTSKPSLPPSRSQYFTM